METVRCSVGHCWTLGLPTPGSKIPGDLRGCILRRVGFQPGAMPQSSPSKAANSRELISVIWRFPGLNRRLADLTSVVVVRGLLSNNSIVSLQILVSVSKSVETGLFPVGFGPLRLPLNLSVLPLKVNILEPGPATFLYTIQW